jgi:hypothetical protein
VDMPEDGWFTGINVTLLDTDETLMVTDDKLASIIFCSTLGCTNDTYSFPSSFLLLLLDFSDRGLSLKTLTS